MSDKVLQAVLAAGDTKAAVGASVTLGGSLVALTEWMPVFGAAITMSVGILTAIYLYKGIKLRDQEIARNNKEMIRRDDD